MTQDNGGIGRWERLNSYQQGARKRIDVSDPLRYGRPIFKKEKRLVKSRALHTRAEKIAPVTDLGGGSQAPHAQGAHYEGVRRETISN